MISIVILRAHKKKDHGTKFIAPISDVKLDPVLILFVDDTDILHLDMNNEETVLECHEVILSGVVNWEELLIATEGTLKPEKCFYHLI